MKRSIKLILIAFIISFVGSFFSEGGQWVGFVNFLFFISILLLMLGGTLFVLKGGMFDGIFYSFRRIYSRTSKIENYVSEQTGELQNTPKISLSGLSIHPIIISGVALFFISFIAAYM
ncbi:DUF3899 domain-containing protein [Cytobacillus depressus]|uniref:DUF3899 domain-containing protein n=1 Tax=Cytobacillus depressus TaxID=1602942 RepID=A0A6L3V573_9BACI|nr:DUF3899 domain-containing protein [Cytobacillus depressus]KAB2334662.1 DUF3899 domain-containing protein [Cytobacillus depressus]